MKKILNKFLWIIYPIIVILVVIVSGIFLWGSGQIVKDMLNKSKQVQEVNKLKFDLENKLNVLKSMNSDQSLSDLKELLQIVPAEKQAWVLIREVRQSIEAIPNSSLKGYRTSDSATDSILALIMTVSTQDFKSLIEIIKNIEVKKPLVEFNSISYQDGLVSLKVAGMWEPLLSASFSASTTLSTLSKPIKTVLEEGNKLNLPTGLDLLPLR